MKPKIGDVVTIDYEMYSVKEGVPVNPTITRIRHDLDWDVVVEEYLRATPKSNVMNSTVLLLINHS